MFEEWFLNYKPDDIKSKVNDKEKNNEIKEKNKGKKIVKRKTKKNKKKGILGLYGGKTYRNY